MGVRGSAAPAELKGSMRWSHVDVARAIPDPPTRQNEEVMKGLALGTLSDVWKRDGIVLRLDCGHCFVQRVGVRPDIHPS